MENLSGSIQLGDILYYPVVDLVSCGFLIERFKTKKLLPPSGNPCGYPDIIWSYGNIGWYQSRIPIEPQMKIYSCGRVYRTIDECIDKLEKHRVQFIEECDGIKKQSVGEVEELEKLLREIKLEAKDSVRIANKKLSMLRSLSISDSLKNKKLIE